jgi:hypothetical protein
MSTLNRPLKNRSIFRFYGSSKPMVLLVGIATGMSFTLDIKSNNINSLSYRHIPGQQCNERDKTIVDRRCPRCNETKVLGEFFKNRSKPDGHESHCKVCVLAKKRRPKVTKGGPIELALSMKPSMSFDEGLSDILDIICREIIDSA